MTSITKKYAPSTVTITLTQDVYGNVAAGTDLAVPQIGTPVTPVQSLGLQIVTQLRHARVDVQHGTQHVPALALALDLTSPEMYGWAASSGASRHARTILAESQDKHTWAATGASA